MKRKPTMERPIPLQYTDRVKKINTQYGDTFKLLDKFRTMCLENGMKWDSRCYLPLTAFVELSRNMKHLDNLEGCNELMFHTYQWRQYKQIYSFDSEFASELFQSDSKAVDTAVFANLPYNSFYVEVKDGFTVADANGKVYDVEGFFCAYNGQVYDVNELPLSDSDFLNCLHIMFITKDGAVIGCPLKTQSGMTVEESLAFYLMAVDVTAASKEDRVSFERASAILPQLLYNAVQLILYICSINSDVQENPEQKKIYKAPTAHSVSKDRISEVRKWDVGYRIGRIIRESKASEHKSHSSHTTSSAKRPHSRRGHFHHYWTGKRDSADRKLIVKWLPPMFINAKLNDEMPAVITKIES